MCTSYKKKIRGLKQQLRTDISFLRIMQGAFLAVHPFCSRRQTLSNLCFPSLPLESFRYKPLSCSTTLWLVAREALHVLHGPVVSFVQSPRVVGHRVSSRSQDAFLLLVVKKIAIIYFAPSKITSRSYMAILGSPSLQRGRSTRKRPKRAGVQYDLPGVLTIHVKSIRPCGPSCGAGQ
jgi:hypothetical protein